MVVMATTAHHRKLWSGRHGRFYVSRGEFAGSVRSYKPKPAPPISASTPLLFREEAAKAAPVDIIGPQATSQFDALLAAQRDLQQQAKNDPAWSKQR